MQEFQTCGAHINDQGRWYLNTSIKEFPDVDNWMHNHGIWALFHEWSLYKPELTVNEINGVELKTAPWMLNASKRVPWGIVDNGPPNQEIWATPKNLEPNRNRNSHGKWATDQEPKTYGLNLNQRQGWATSWQVFNHFHWFSSTATWTTWCDGQWMMIEKLQI